MFLRNPLSVLGRPIKLVRVKLRTESCPSHEVTIPNEADDWFRDLYSAFWDEG